MLFYVLAFSIAIFDQLLKIAVSAHMKLGQSVPLLGSAVKLTYVRNSGAAFSLFAGSSLILAFVGALVAISVILIHHRLPRKSGLLQLALALILGGSLGNMIDRGCFFSVVDYIDLGIWPVFNFADIMINAGVFLLVVNLLKEGKNAAGNI